MKQGQITIFIILGIVIVIAFGFIIYAKNTIIQSESESNSPTKQANFEGSVSAFSTYVDSCLKMAFQDSIGYGNGNIETAKQYMKMKAADCFDDSLFPGISIEVDLPPDIEIIETEDAYRITLELDTIITQEDITKNLQQYSFIIQKSEVQESQPTQDTITIDDQEFMLPPAEIIQELPPFVEGEILVSYQNIPEDLGEYNTKLEDLPILSRKPIFKNFMGDIEALDPRLRNALIDFASDEVMTFNESEMSFEELKDVLLQFDFVSEVSRNKNSYINFFRPPPRRMFKTIELEMNDTLYKYQWYLQNWGQFFGIPNADIDPTPAWNITKGDVSTIIAVIDQGIFSNSDISPAILYDQNYDFVENDTDISPTSADEYHATQVAGIIASQLGNNYGIAGICPGCKIISMRVMDAESGVDSETLLAAIIKSISHGADIVSMSLGGTYYSEYEDRFFKELSDNGIIFVAAAGNDGINQKNYPAAYDGVIAVGAIDNTDRIAYFSNYGAWVDIYAPGEMIVSACSEDEYCFSSGTSMAAPIISASIGLIKSIEPDLSSQEIISILQKSADTIQSGVKRINLGNAIKRVLKIH